MGTAILAVAGLIGLAVAVFLALHLNLHRHERARVRRVQRGLMLLVDSVARTGVADDEALGRALFDPQLTADAIRAMADYDAEDQLPEEYRTLEALAEADLRSWLMHPHELGSNPAEMELVERFDLTLPHDTVQFTYFVFRFRAMPSSFVADRGWMAGISGPYYVPDGLRNRPMPGLLSELEPMDKVDPRAYAETYHAGIAARLGRS